MAPRTLADRCEAATGPQKALDREIALLVGWCRQSPSEAKRKHPAWFHPDDCRDGKPIFDSLHGTDVWRDPSAFTASIDAAMTLVPKGWETAIYCGGELANVQMETERLRQQPCFIPIDGTAATPALALCAAALRALTQTGDA